MASSAASEAAGRMMDDDHDGWASDGEVDVEMEVGGEDADRRDGGADENDDDAYSLVSASVAFRARESEGADALWFRLCSVLKIA
jgi:hypothetical protein